MKVKSIRKFSSVKSLDSDWEQWYRECYPWTPNIMDRAEAHEALATLEAEAAQVREWLRTTRRGDRMPRVDLSPVILDEAPWVPHRRSLFSYPEWLTDLPTFDELCSAQTTEHDGASRTQDLGRDLSLDLEASDLIVGSRLKLEIARALNASKVHTRWDDRLDRMVPITNRVRRRDGSFYDAYVTEQLNHIGRAWQRQAFDLNIVGLEYDGSFIVVEYGRRWFDMTSASGRKSWMMICLGRKAANIGSKFVWEPFRFLEASSADDAEQVAQSWHSELRLIDDDFDRHAELDERVM